MAEEDKYNLSDDTKKKIREATGALLGPNGPHMHMIKAEADFLKTVKEHKSGSKEYEEAAAKMLSASEGGGWRGAQVEYFKEHGLKSKHEIYAGGSLLDAVKKQMINGIHGPINYDAEMAKGVEEATYGGKHPVDPQLLAKPPKLQEERKEESRSK